MIPKAEHKDTKKTSIFRRGVRRLLGTFLIFGIIASVLAAAAIIGGFFRFTTEIGKTGSYMLNDDNIAAVDGIVALTGGQERIKRASIALQNKRGQRLLITGVNKSTSLQDIAKSNGLNSADLLCCVDIDHEALDTIGNAQAAAKWVRVNGYESIIIVTSNLHMIRSLLEFKRALPDTELIPLPVSVVNVEDKNWLFEPNTMRLMFVEYSKYLAALLRGYVDGNGAFWTAIDNSLKKQHARKSA